MAYANGEMIYRHHQAKENSNQTNNDEQMGVGVMVVIFSLSSLMGLWGVSCIVSGIFHTGGLFQMGASWVSAVLGM